MRTISLKIPETTERTLTRLAKEQKTTRSAVIRMAIEALAAQKARPVRGFAPDLRGTLEGPGDLSTNKRHMEGYGR